MLVVPGLLNRMLRLGRFSLLSPVLAIYKVCRKLRMEWLLKAAILPPAYKSEIKALDSAPS